MRWNWRDGVIGLLAVAVTVPVCLPVILWDLSILRIGNTREWVESFLGQPSETVPNYYCISIKGTTEAEREWTREAIHTESCRYSHPLYAIKVEYRGYRYQRLKSASFVPVRSWANHPYLLTVPVFAVGAVVSRLVRRQFIAGNSPVDARA